MSDRRRSRSLRAFGPAGLAAIAVVLASALAGPPIAAAMVLLWAYASGTALADLGFRRPKSWPATIAGGVAAGVGLKLLLKTAVMPLLHAPPTNEQYAFLIGNAAALPGMVLTIVFSAGVAEEIFYRGLLFERATAALGRSSAAMVVALAVSTTLFALAHLADQGVAGAEQAAFTGLVFGGMYARSRQLWVVMLAHVAFDLTALLIIFRGWEVLLAQVFM